MARREQGAAAFALPVRGAHKHVQGRLPGEEDWLLVEWIEDAHPRGTFLVQPSHYDRSPG